MENHGFYKFILPLEKGIFNKLLNSADFEDVANGRKGNHLVDSQGDQVPIVRTTTKYNKPANYFAEIHTDIVESIKSVACDNQDLQNLPLSFNNALIETYDHSYTKMKYHSDQNMDLADGSFIALFSCYEQLDELPEQALRKLKVKSKATEEEFEFSLENNSVILFSLFTNTNFQHKIVLEIPEDSKLDNLNQRWLGITFRQSKTFIHFKDGVPHFSNGELLKLADKEQSKAFYKLRSLENSSVNFSYPAISYTLSTGDILEPKK